MKYSADVRGLIAKLQATLAGSSEGRRSAAIGGTPPTACTRSMPVSSAGRPSLEPTSQGGGTGRRAPGEGVTGRGSGTVAGLAGSNPAPGTTCCDDWHEQYTARMARALRKQAARTAAYKRKLWREAEAAREERRRGKTYPPDGTDPFRGF